MKDALQAIAQIASNAEELKPLAQEIAKGIKTFGPEIASVLDATQEYLIDSRAKAVKRLEEVHGFSRADAIVLTLDVHGRIQRAIETQRKS